MPVQHFVDEQGRYDGRTLQELWPSVVDEVVRAVDPAEVILFGSVARGVKTVPTPTSISLSCSTTSIRRRSGR